MRGNPNEAIERLRYLGYNVDVRHTRFSEKAIETALAERESRPPKFEGKLDYDGSGISPKGGITQITISRKVSATDGVLCFWQKLVSGTAVCSPYDNFDKNLGMRIALGRAIDRDRESSRGSFLHHVAHGNFHPEALELMRAQQTGARPLLLYVDPEVEERLRKLA